jgi:hypothetical protein
MFRIVLPHWTKFYWMNDKWMNFLDEQILKVVIWTSLDIMGKMNKVFVTNKVFVSYHII